MAESQVQVSQCSVSQSWMDGLEVERGVHVSHAVHFQTQTITVAQAGVVEVEMWAVSRGQGYDGRVSE